MGDTLVLLNARAGALIDAGADRVRDALASSLKGRSERVEIRLVRPAYLKDEIEQAAQSDMSTLIVGGGDGSVNCAVACACRLDQDAGRAAVRHDESVRTRSRNAGRYRGRRSKRSAMPRPRTDRSRPCQWPLFPFAVGARLFQPDGARARGGARPQAWPSLRGRPRGDPCAAADQCLHTRYPHREPARACRGAGGAGDQQSVRTGLAAAEYSTRACSKSISSNTPAPCPS